MKTSHISAILSKVGQGYLVWIVKVKMSLWHNIQYFDTGKRSVWSNKTFFNNKLLICILKSWLWILSPNIMKNDELWQHCFTLKRNRFRHFAHSEVQFHYHIMKYVIFNDIHLQLSIMIYIQGSLNFFF